MINEHDMTKSMIDKMKSTLLREFVNQPKNQDPGYTETDVETSEPKTEIKEISFLDDNGNLRSDVPENMKVYWEGTESEKKKFMDGVTPDVTFTSFSITPKVGGDEGDVKITGVLNNVGIGFSMNKKQNIGLMITTAPTKTSQDGR